jgi:integrase
MLLSELPSFCAHDEHGVPRVASATATLYRHAVGSFVRWRGRDGELPEVSCQEVYDYQQWLRDESGLTVVAANTYRRTLRALFRRGGRAELADHLKDLRPPPRRGGAMSDETLAALLGVAGVRDKAILLLLRDSGARRGAVCGLRRDAVRLWQVGDEWRLAAHAVTKGGVTVLLLGGHECACAVRSWLAVSTESIFLFCTASGGKMAPQTINSMFRELAIAAGIPQGERINPHSLRHRFAQRMLARHDAKIVSQLMGHAEVATTLDIYAQRDEGELMRLFYND